MAAAAKAAKRQAKAATVAARVAAKAEDDDELDEVADEFMRIYSSKLVAVCSYPDRGVLSFEAHSFVAWVRGYSAVNGTYFTKVTFKRAKYRELRKASVDKISKQAENHPRKAPAGLRG